METCSICLENIHEDPVCTGSCSHLFHRQCLTIWIVTRVPAQDGVLRLSCPYCRRIVMGILRPPQRNKKDEVVQGTAPEEKR